MYNRIRIETIWEHNDDEGLYKDGGNFRVDTIWDDMDPDI